LLKYVEILGFSALVCVMLISLSQLIPRWAARVILT